MVQTHENSKANAVGVIDERYNGKVVHFRGIKYGHIPKRFSSPELVERSKTTKLEALKYGPRCPHPPNDVRELMQIPRNLDTWEAEKEDELECCSLNITCPVDAKPGSLPVMFWIYGGAQVISFSSAAQRLGDAGPLVAQSIESGKPIVLVTINYRLNIFAYGDGKGERNLALQDQRVALDWVNRYVADFGGDPNNLTLAGESAGGIYVHALVATGTRPKRVILCSGSLYTSDPKPHKIGRILLEAVTKRAVRIESKKSSTVSEYTLSNIPAQTLVQAMTECGVTSMSLQEDESIQGWQENDVEVFKHVDGVMVGECEFESMLWLFGARAFPEAAVVAQFQTKPPGPGVKVANTYLKDPQNKKSKLGMVKAGALDFIGDAHFAYPSYLIGESLRNSHSSTASESGPKVYQYTFDEGNPWAKPNSSGARAHHAVDLLAIFGGYDDDISKNKSNTMVQTGRTLRQNYINFVNGEEPWSGEKIYGYGPNGMCGELNESEYAKRRRTKHFAVLKEVGREVYDTIWTKLAGAADVALAQRPSNSPDASKQQASKL